MKTNEQRINIIIGQLEGIKKKLNSPKADCFALITQLKAIKAATSSLMEAVINEEFGKCLLGKGQKKTEDIKKFFQEIIKK
jgi:DNA-binding FrmR family transcriptional regulator